MKCCKHCEKGNILDLDANCPRCAAALFTLMVTTDVPDIGNGVSLVHERVTYVGQKVTRKVQAHHNGVFQFGGANEEWSELAAPFTAPSNTTVQTNNGPVVVDTNTVVTVVAHTWNIDRPVRVSGAVAIRNTGGRASAPPPLSSGMTAVGDDIAELGEFNNGHVVALVLGGPDVSGNVVPMVRWLNQSGAWRTMEQRLQALVANPPAAPLAGAGGVALGAPAVLVVHPLRMTVELEYSALGDPRVPVGFYVQLTRGAQQIAHFLLANDAAALPAPTLDEEKAFVMAHWVRQLHPFDTGPRRQAFLDHHAPPTAQDIAAGRTSQFDAGTITDDQVWAVIDAVAAQPVVLPAPMDATVPLPTPPYAALQWLDDQNVGEATAGRVARYVAVPMEPVLAQQDFSTTQRNLVRKYCRWRNAGQIHSDGRAHIYLGERPDPYPVLSEGSGRAFPEADHVVPKHRNGRNAYDNCRLVSFALNHIYRDKLIAGSLPLCHANYANDGWHATLPALKDSMMPRRITSASPYYLVRHLLGYRKRYLEAEARGRTAWQAEETRRFAFQSIAARHVAGVVQFRAVCTAAEQARLVADFGNVALG
jgi:hypothetical protein